MSGLMEKFKEMWNPSEEIEESEENFLEKEESKKNFSNYEPIVEQTKGQKIVNIHSNNKLKVILSKPSQFGEEIKNIADELLKLNTVVLNLELTPKNDARRLVDFLSGIAYAIGGKIKNVSTDTFVVTPSNVDIEGEDLLSEMESRNMYF